VAETHLEKSFLCCLIKLRFEHFTYKSVLGSCSRSEDCELKERIAIRLNRAFPATPIRTNSYRKIAFAASPKKTVNGSTKGYDHVLPLILPQIAKRMIATMTVAIKPAPWPALYQPMNCPMIPARNEPAIQSTIVQMTPMFLPQYYALYKIVPKEKIGNFLNQKKRSFGKLPQDISLSD
jgi:hypothetical protein